MKRVLLLFTLLTVGAARLLAQSTVPAVASPIAAQALTVGAPSAEFDLATVFTVPDVSGQIVQFDTTFGKFNVETLATAAPDHVANFLAYVNAGDYSNTFFHRVNGLGTSSPAILQGGGYYATLPGAPTLTKRTAVNLEYNLPNARGTLAAARTSDVNSATSEWFFNTQDNSTTLGPLNASGYSVFARVLGTGMTIVDTIAENPLYNLGGAFTETPLRDITVGQTTLLVSNFITVNSTTVIPLFPAATGQTAVVTFTVSSDHPNVATATLVGGHTLSINPVGAGSATLTLTATDTNGNSAQTTAAVTVVATTAPDRRDVLTLGTASTLPLAVSGYSTWTTPGTLPAWLSLSSTTGALTGTPPADTPAFTFLLNARDANSAVFGQNVTLLFKAPDSPDRAFSPADFTEAVTGRTLAGLSFTSATAFTDPSEPAGSAFRSGTWTYSSPSANQARITLTYPSANPVTREGIDLYHRGPLATDALRYDLDNSDVASGHQLTSADFRSTFLPREIAASVVDSRNVSLTWRDEAWADGYNVYRTGSSTPPAAGATPLNGATALTSAAYTDVAPARGSAHYYWITAVRAGQETTPLAAAPTSIIVRDVPLVLSQPTTVMAALNATQRFDVTTFGTGLTYQWYFKGKPVSKATNEDLSVRATAAAAGVYSLKITDNTGDTAQADITLVVVSTPRLTVQPATKRTLGLGGSATFSVSATGLALDYQWFLNGQSLAGETSATLVLANVTTAAQGKYTVRVHNIAGSVTSRGTALTVLIPPSVQSVSGPATVVTGQPFTLTAAASGSARLAYQWSLNGTAIPKATKPTYAVKKAAAANSGSYTVTVTNSVGATTSVPRVLEVTP